MLYVPEPGQAPLSYTAAPFDPTRSRLSRLYGRGNLPNPNALQSFQAAQDTLQDDDDFRLSLVPGWVGGWIFFFFFRFGTSLAHSAVWSPSTRPPCLMVLMRPVGPLAPVASAQFPRSPSDSKPVRSSPWVPCPRQISVFWVLSYLPPSAKRVVFCHFLSTQTQHRYNYNGEKGSGNVRRGLNNVRECFSKKSEIWGLHNVRAEYEKPALNPPFRAFW